MKKIFFMGIMGMFLLGSCNNHSGHNHEGHDHDHEGHNHATEASHGHEGHNHEGHNHDHEGHAHEHEGLNHAHEGHAHEHGSNPDEIILAPEKAKAAGVESMIVEPKSFRQVIKTSGEIQTAQGAESVVVANVSGVVSFQRAIVDGANVGKGATILSISADKLQDGDPAERARIAYETAKAEYDRANRLVGSQIISQKEFNAIKETYENARLSYEALSKNKTAKGVSVTTPIAGYIKNLMVKEGDYVTVGQPLLTVTQNNKLFLRADVSERYYRYLKGITTANFKTPYDNQVYELEQLNGKILSYGKASGGGSYYVPVTFSFDNKVDVVPGSFVEIYLMSKEQPYTLAIPVEALTEEQGLYFIYLQKCEESYKKQEVKLGASNGKEVEIVSGLHAGDRVVVKGAYHVKLASASNALPAHSHEH